MAGPVVAVGDAVVPVGLIRLGVFLAALWPASAWADTIDVASLVRDGGPWGMVTVLCSVIGFLWFKLGAKEETITTLQNKRGDEADARAERFAKIAEGANTTAAGMVKAMEGVDDTLGQLKDVVKLQSAGTDALLKGQDANATRGESLQRGLNKLLGDRA